MAFTRKRKAKKYKTYKAGSAPSRYRDQPIPPAPPSTIPARRARAATPQPENRPPENRQNGTPKKSGWFGISKSKVTPGTEKQVANGN